ncbi:hypothetical protein [Burkholderia sp. Bp8998]|uniref:hypothetical protein n=1 Tax=Burkholderia sp. Bp8998 TaxID=2184557 RepID=UPI000F5ADD2D|nr:hypothetical protein [Burkholderia sp. Bp8998]RQS04894.1 hypothetical protein DIE06_37200 [Burkholderia sp. Bp8998]
MPHNDGAIEDAKCFARVFRRTVVFYPRANSIASAERTWTRRPDRRGRGAALLRERGGARPDRMGFTWQVSLAGAHALDCDPR